MAASVSLVGRKRKRKVLTIGQKISICDLAKKGRTLQSLASEYGVGKSTVHDIVKNGEKLKQFQKEICEGVCVKKRKTMKKSTLDELDHAVYLWFVQQRCKGKNAKELNCL